MTDTANLEDGFYWVRYFGEWEVSKRQGGRLWLTALEEPVPASHFEEIDPRPIKREERMDRINKQGNINSEPRLLMSATRRGKDGGYLGEVGLASPVESGPEALEAAIEQLQRLKATVAREPYVDWHIQINVRPK